MSDGESTERVEELEQQVAELEATVRGLTEELVDRTERIRQLEAEHDLNDGGTEPEPDADEDKGSETEGGDERDSESGDDIIVA